MSTSIACLAFAHFDENNFNLTGTWMTADFDSGMGDNVGAFAMPTWNGGVAGGGSFALPWHISSKASNPDLAAKFLHLACHQVFPPGEVTGGHVFPAGGHLDGCMMV